MHYNISLGIAKKHLFFIKKIIQCGDGDVARIPEPVENRDVRFNFSTTLGMSRITDKYISIGYGDGKCKTRPHPVAMPNFSYDSL